MCTTKERSQKRVLFSNLHTVHNYPIQAILKVVSCSFFSYSHTAGWMQCTNVSKKLFRFCPCKCNNNTLQSQGQIVFFVSTFETRKASWHINSFNDANITIVFTIVLAFRKSYFRNKMHWTRWRLRSFFSQKMVLLSTVNDVLYCYDFLVWVFSCL